MYKDRNYCMTYSRSQLLYDVTDIQTLIKRIK